MAKYPCFSVTADIVVLRRGNILLIKRKKPPFKGHWALPGGFLDIDENAVSAARRELREETGLTAGKLVEVGVFSEPKRDPRGRVVSVAFVTRNARGRAVASDDAGDACWFAVSKLPKLAFDHRIIIRRALKT